jgi:signal peptidase II
MTLTTSQRAVWLAPTALALIALDQVTKIIAQKYLVLGNVHSFFGDTARLQLAHNRGAFLSLGASLPEAVRQPLFSIGVGILLLGILWYALRGKDIQRGGVIALALIFAGGASNLYDRVIYGGYVIDFLNVGIGWLRTGIFNVADMAIMAGAGIALVDALRARRTVER